MYEFGTLRFGALRIVGYQENGRCVVDCDCGNKGVIVSKRKLIAGLRQCSKCSPSRSRLACQQPGSIHDLIDRKRRSTDLYRFVADNCCTMREARKSHCSQRELAGSLGVPQSCISHVEHGRCDRIRFETLNRIVAAYKELIDACCSATQRPETTLQEGS